MIADAEQRRPVHPWWLLLVVPLCVLGVTSALLGFILERAYARETSAWVLQAHAQDAANLAIGLPVIAIAAWFAARGSLAAMCVMLGAIVNIVYAAVIYAFGVHFGPLFLLHVAILSVSTWSLVGGIAALDRERISAKMSTRPPPPWVGALIVGVAVLFTGLWLSQIVPANLAGRIPSELQEVGLATNPVHVLDLAYLLPLSYVAGVSLMLRRSRGYWIAAVLLPAQALICSGIVAIMAFQIAEGSTAAVGPAIGIGAATLALCVAAWVVCRGLAAE